MRKCHTCNRSTFDSAKFCHHCGAKIITNKKDCPACNHTNDPAAHFCENCGFELTLPAPSAIPATKKKSIFDAIKDDDEHHLSSENLAQKDEITADMPNDTPPLVEFVKDESTENENESEDDATDDLDDELLLIFEESDQYNQPLKRDKSAIIFEIVEKTDDDQATETDEDLEEQADDFMDEEIEEFINLSDTSIADKEPVTSKKPEETDEATTLTAEEEEDWEDFDLKMPPPINDIFEKNPNDSVENEIFEKFSVAFEQQIKAEQNPAQYNEYVDRFEESDFKLSFEFRVKQLAEEVQKIRLDGNNLLKNEDNLLERAFTELIDYFVILYCKDLNEITLPESILKYQNIAPDQIDLSQMVIDYLDFEEEDEKVYFDFITMPLNRLQNASKAFLFPEKGEKIFFICDQSILGSGKEGFAMTEKAIYWKMPFENAERVYYKNLRTIEPQKDWITINDMFFNTNQSLNIKMMKLLKKIQTVLHPF